MKDGYNIFRDGEFVHWFARDRDVFAYLFDQYFPGDNYTYAVYDQRYPKPKLILLLGDINATNKYATEAFDNA